LLAIRGVQPLHAPGADMHVAIGGREAGAEVCPAGALGVQQAFARPCHGGVGEQDLAGGDRRLQILGDAGPAAEKGELEAGILQRPVERAGDVPPLGAEIRVGAVVAWKGEPRAAPGGRIARDRAEGQRRQKQRGE
jgi:hypothetical protein